MARILLGVTGGIAAYKACTLLRLLVRAGHDVYPVLTPSAERFVTAETFFALARKSRSDDPYPHLERADLLVVAPLTANTLARLAHGLADDLLTEAALAHIGPVLIAPAMNVRMWEHPATRENVSVLRARGVEIVGPAEGELAEGEVGVGRMAEPDEIAARVLELVGGEIAAGPLHGRRVLVSAGGTREPLDAVRFLGNRSSGRMGVALAEEARHRGAEVTLLAANLAVPPPSGVAVVDTPTAADVEREALARADADVIVMAAAVADYRSPTPLAGKRPKDRDAWTMELEPTSDVLAALGAARSPDQVLVGFAADRAGAGLERAREKRLAKSADLFVFNDVSRADIGFDATENEVVVLSEAGELHVGKAPKREIAAAVLDEVERLLSKR
ncbi:MAG: bifunctional phosphopantothenoylcysteine decarboxylase/phosphopantothenate--cysteine ligase CoaBC [Gaiellaceae bacterium]